MAAQLLPWQTGSWAQLQQMLARLPHALLIHGPRGCGKTLFAERFAQALLCEAPVQDGHPCDACPSCTWFAQYAHPDYRRVRPEVFDDEQSTESDDANADAKAARASKTPSKEIRIDQIRALGDFINVSTHRQGRRVVLLYPAEAMNSASANSLLKMLEEPPPNTVFLLVTQSLDRLLPTIRSRCRQFAMTAPQREQALQWLQAEGVADAEILLDEQGGAPLAARDMADSDLRASIDVLLAFLARSGSDGALKTAEVLQKVALPVLVASLQRWLIDLFALKLSGRIRYHPRYHRQLAELANRCDVSDLERVLKSVSERRAIADHPLSARLFLEDMLLEYSSLFTDPRRSG